MTGGLIELVARGIQDIFLTNDPQVTFFKTVFRRYTNFSMETIPQYFKHTPDFGKKVSCVISRCGDLITKSYLVIDLPAIPQFTSGQTLDNITKFAWVKKIGYAIIKTIRIDINEQLIDKQYGEWLNIWSELNDNKTNGFNKLIGNVTELTSFSNGKNTYRMYVPLQFWFCRASGLALPLICLMFSEVKLTIELNDSSNCYMISPSHYIELADSSVNYTKFEYIEQTYNNSTAAGIYMDFDSVTKRLYYYKLTTNSFQSYTYSGTVTNSVLTSFYSSIASTRYLTQNLSTNNNNSYFIVGLTSGYAGTPNINASPVSHTHSSLGTISLSNCFLLIEYAYIDEDERAQFIKNKHEYLIETITYIKERAVTSSSLKVSLDISHPCKLILWILQYDYNYNAKDTFNYTNSYKHTDGTNYIYSGDAYVGTNIINYETLYFNGYEVLTYRSANYFNWIQHYQNFLYTPTEGINLFSFSLIPYKPQPMGTFNASMIDNIQVMFDTSHLVSQSNPAKFRGYAISYNVFRISNGVGSLVFSN